MSHNYFFIDGSALTSQIRTLQTSDKSFRGKILDAQLFVNYFASSLPELLSNEFKRAIYYFPIGDEVAVSEYINSPDHKTPGAVRDVHFKFCGYKLKGSTAFRNFVESKVPKKWKDRFTKSEKGIDIEICCDAIKLASAGRIDRLFLLTNDDDFVPLCRTLKEFGANISLIHLSSAVNCNHSLAKEMDSYDVVPLENLRSMFLAPAVTAVKPGRSDRTRRSKISQKPDTAPSDLVVDHGSDSKEPVDADDIPEADG